MVEIQTKSITQDYRILEQLGKGGNGLVRRCEMLHSVAMKTIKFEESYREIAMKEAEIIKKFPPHKNIIKYKDIFITDKSELALVMEYANLGTLDSLISKSKMD